MKKKFFSLRNISYKLERNNQVKFFDGTKDDYLFFLFEFDTCEETNRTKERSFFFFSSLAIKLKLPNGITYIYIYMCIYVYIRMNVDFGFVIFCSILSSFYFSFLFRDPLQYWNRSFVRSNKRTHDNFYLYP